MVGDQIHHMLTSIVAAVSLGILLIVVSRKYNVPGIVLLLVAGFLLGPEVLGVVKPDSLGNGLSVIASLSIGLILFEGALTLNIDEYLGASKMIKRLLTIGVLITWLSTATALYFIFDMPSSTAFVAASLVIVTGPTVIAPLLRRINVTTRLRTILHWEGVLIDPIGVFIAVLCFEWVATEGAPTALVNFAARVGLGCLVGGLGGYGIYFAVKRNWIPEHMINLFALASALLTFGICETVLSESGLLAVTIAGFYVGFKKPVQLAEIREFKEQVTDLLIGTLFILLASRLKLQQFAYFGLQGAAVVAIVMFAVRPLSIMVCSRGLGLNWREKLFLSWVAPRGIVAASMASLFVLSGKIEGVGEDTRFVETFVYSVICATIILQGFSAGALARLLGLYQPERRGWIIVGAHRFAQEVAQFISKASAGHVILIDANSTAVNDAKRRGFHAILSDARSPDALDLDEILGVYSVGNLLALTDNEDLNTLICQRWSREVASSCLYRWGRSGGSSDGHAGKLIWSDLPKPSLLSDALDSQAVRIVAQDEYRETSADVSTPIAVFHEGRILLQPEFELKERPSVSPTLYLEQSARTRA